MTDAASTLTRADSGSTEPVLIVGAGLAGLAAAAGLGKLGVPSEVIDGSEAVGSSWRRRYDRLRMNTCRWNISLWFGPFPKGTPVFPTRDEFVRYMESYVSRHDLQVRFGVRVGRIDRVADGWRLATSAGERTAGQVVVATGQERVPRLPDWPGRHRFPGRLLHSAEYRNPREFHGQDVLVVGSGCSGMDIAADLVQGGAGKVRLAIRTPPHIMMRNSAWGPNDILAALLQRVPTRIGDSVDRLIRRRTVGDLAPWGIALPDEGTFTVFRRDGAQPTIIDPDVLEAIRDGGIEIVTAVSSVDADGVRLADGAHLRPDAIIAATGFRAGLEPLVGHLGVLDRQGGPRRDRESAAGLHFLGFEGSVGVIGPRARSAARRLCREVASERSGAGPSRKFGARAAWSAVD